MVVVVVVVIIVTATMPVGGTGRRCYYCGYRHCHRPTGARGHRRILILDGTILLIILIVIIVIMSVHVDQFMPPSDGIGHGHTALYITQRNIGNIYCCCCIFFFFFTRLPGTGQY